MARYAEGGAVREEVRWPASAALGKSFKFVSEQASSRPAPSPPDPAPPASAPPGGAPR